MKLKGTGTRLTIWIFWMNYDWRSFTNQNNLYQITTRLGVIKVCASHISTNHLRVQAVCFESPPFLEYFTQFGRRKYHPCHQHRYHILQSGLGSKTWPFREKNCIKIRFCGHIVFCAARELVQVAKTSGLIKTKCVLAHLTFPWQFSFDLAVVCDGDHIKDVQK